MKLYQKNKDPRVIGNNRLAIVSHTEYDTLFTKKLLGFIIQNTSEFKISIKLLFYSLTRSTTHCSIIWNQYHKMYTSFLKKNNFVYAFAFGTI